MGVPVESVAVGECYVTEIWPSPSRTGDQERNREIRISGKDSAWRIVGRPLSQ
jgi:hypothetical protein